MATSPLPTNPAIGGGGSILPTGFNPSGFTNEQLAAIQAGGAIPFTRPGGGSSLFYGTGLETPEQRMAAFAAMMADPGIYGGRQFEPATVTPVDYSGTRGATPAAPATPAVPGVSPAVRATPAVPPTWMQQDPTNLWRAQQLIAAAARARAVPPGAAASSSAAPRSFQGGMTGGLGWGPGGTQQPGPPPGVMNRARGGFQPQPPWGTAWRAGGMPAFRPMPYQPFLPPAPSLPFGTGVQPGVAPTTRLPFGTGWSQ